MDDNTILKVKDLSINFETKHGVVRVNRDAANPQRHWA